MSTITEFLSVSSAAGEYGVSVQRMHQLIHQYDVQVEHLAGGRFFLISRHELEKIPKNRRLGRPAEK
jgi:hypothetical protein